MAARAIASAVTGRRVSPPLLPVSVVLTVPLAGGVADQPPMAPKIRYAAARETLKRIEEKVLPYLRSRADLIKQAYDVLR